ncbi:MAG: DUF5610 domain-containing protein [Chitinivibrionia bacterium]|nr:DUF5610 domain-containing protein [Chitinivibrionia bacterium]
MELSSLNSLSFQPEPSTLTSATPGQTAPTGQPGLTSLSSMTAESSSVSSSTQMDLVILNPMTEDTSQGILNQQIRLALTETLDVNLASTSPGYPTDLSPTPLSGQILSAVRGVLSVSVAPPEPESPSSAPIDLARTGVDQGVQETRNILSSLGVTDGQLLASVDQTQGLIHQGLDTMAANPPVAAPVNTSLTYTSTYARAQSTSLQIQTADGDTVTLEISNQQGRLSDLSVSGDGTGVANTATDVALNEDSLAFTVNGSLDRKELKAIGKLMHKVSEIAEKFFKGDIFESLKKVSSLEFDTKRLSGFSLNLSFEEVRQIYLTQQSAPVLDTPAPADTSSPAVPQEASPVPESNIPASVSPTTPSVAPSPADQNVIQAAQAAPTDGTPPSPTPNPVASPVTSGDLAVLIQAFQQFVSELESSGLFRNPMKAMDDMVDTVGHHRHRGDDDAKHQMKLGFQMLKALVTDRSMSS